MFSTRLTECLEGSFWGAYGATLVPWFNAYGSYVTDPAVAAAYQGNPGNPAGLVVPAFDSSFAFFQIFMGMSDQRKGDVQRGHKLNDVSRIAMLHLPDLLAPHQHRLLRNILHLSRCIRLPCGRLLQSGLVLREQREPWCLGHGVQTCPGTFLW